MAVKKQYILLLLDNAPSHIHNLQLTYVRIEMLPPNTTAHIQPTDAGIIKNFKLHYKKKLLQQYVRQVDEQGTFDRINLKQAIYFVKDATVTEQTIANCFAHVRILPENNPDAIIPIQQNPQQEAEKELSELIVSTSIENPLTVDECLTEEPMTDEDIIGLVLGETPSFNDRDSDDDEEIPLTAPPYTLAEAVQIGERLLTTLEVHDGFTEHDYAPLRSLIRKISTVKAKNSKQTTLNDYFSKN